MNSCGGTSATENWWTACCGTGSKAVVNFAAESHVDRSLYEPDVFIQTNVVGVQILLHAGMRHKIKKFVQVSTDEVYGSLGPQDPRFREDFPLAPNSPYSASKAAGDLLARSYFKTYGFPVVVTRCSNNYGPYQFPEKLIPLFVTNALENTPCRFTETVSMSAIGFTWKTIAGQWSSFWRREGQGKSTTSGGRGKNKPGDHEDILQILGKPDP